MSVTLEPVLNALGYQTEQQQRGMVKLLQAAGAFGKLPGVDGVVNDRQADAILKNVQFDNIKSAADWLHDLTQETMKRENGKSRAETPDRADFQANRGALLIALNDAGAISEVKPRLKSYKHVLLLGAMEPTAETRMDSIKQLWEEGIRFDNIHLLGNERPLDGTQERIANIPGKTGETLATETQMLKASYYDKRNNWQESLKQVSTFAVNSFDVDGRPANTRDTIQTWLDANPEPASGDVLVISNQPYLRYQDAAAKSVLPASFNVETAGAAIEPEQVNIALAMDSIARQIDVNFDKLVEKASQSPGLKTTLSMLDPANIKSDPATYQFRSNYDQSSGVTKKGKYEAAQWDPILHGDPLLVHERLDGIVFVADGHHRLELAKRLNNEGKGPGNVATMVLREADGYTPEDVKIIAAYKNISHGKTDPVETARVFKEAYSGKIHTEWLPQLQMDKGNLRLSYTLSGLSDKSLDMVAKGDVPVDMAVEVASRVSDSKSQESVMSVIKEQIQNKTNPDDKSFASRVPRKADTSQGFSAQFSDPYKDSASGYTDKVTADRTKGTERTLH
jgi:hypothetical protein